MLIGSHNSMGYLKPKERSIFSCHYWHTQDNDIEMQYIVNNVRVFDISIAVDTNNHLVFKYHGTTYDTFSVYEVLNYLDKMGDCYARIILDDTAYMTSDRRKLVEKKFQEQCQVFETIYPKLKFFGGLKRSDWTHVYTFKTENLKPILIFPETDTYPFFKPDNNKWNRLLKRFSKKLYAKRMNKGLRDKLKNVGNDICLMIDHVQI